MTMKHTIVVKNNHGAPTARNVPNVANELSRTPPDLPLIGPLASKIAAE
jgi:hypothetical protein